MPRDLLQVARALVDLQNEREEDPYTTALRRKAISACYYAAFSATSAIVANVFSAPDNQTATRFQWRQVYRSLDHRQVVKVARQLLVVKTMPNTLDPNLEKRVGPNQLAIWAKNIVELQQSRHNADYDPFYDPTYEETQSILELAARKLDLLGNLIPNDQSKLAVALAFPPRINT